MEIKQVIFYALILLTFYLLYQYFINDSTKIDLINMHQDCKTQKDIPTSLLPNNNTNMNFTYSFWIYVNNWSHRYGEEKIILERKEGSTVCPKISLGNNSNNLKILMTTKSDAGSDIIEECLVENIPLQKWLNVTITTINKTIDVYLDGKLVKNCVLQGVPEIKQSAISVCPGGGFEGHLAKLRFLSRTVGPREAYEIYKEGYGVGMLGGLLSQYRLRLSFMKNNSEINSLEI